MSEWKVSSNYLGGDKVYTVWRQIREPNPGEPMHSGLLETKFCFQSETEAQNCADELNGKTEKMSGCAGTQDRTKNV